MKCGKTLITLTVLAICCAAGLHGNTIIQTLGSSAGFANGQHPIGVATWNTAVAGNPAPFNGFIGSDASGPNFTATWTFSYGNLAPNTVLDATLTVGIYDLDSPAPGNQVASYTEGANDLTALLNAVSEGLNSSAGAANAEYDILTISYRLQPLQTWRPALPVLR